MNFLIFSLILGFVVCDAEYCDPASGLPQLDPIGVEFGQHPGRVCWSWDPRSTDWDGLEPWVDFWWMNVNEDIVDKMLNDTILCIGSENGQADDDLSHAWDNLFRDLNDRRYEETKGYESGEKVCIKVNLNSNTDNYDPVADSQTSPQLMKSVLRQLTDHVGVAQTDIYIYDAARFFSYFLYDPPYGIGEEFPDINYYDNWGNDSYVEAVEKQSSQTFYFSQTEIPDWDSTRLPSFVVEECRYNILISALRGHTGSGFTASGKNHFGSIAMSLEESECDGWIHPDANPEWCPSQLHGYVQGNNYGDYSPLVDLLGSPDLGGKTVLFLVDGIYAGSDQFSLPLRYDSDPFNDDWTSSIFVAQDPVALDSLVFDILQREPNVDYVRDVEGCNDNYLHEAAERPAPSGTSYMPDGTNELGSLGVHEHANGDMEYSRNLGENYGIELVRTYEWTDDTDDDSDDDGDDDNDDDSFSSAGGCKLNFLSGMLYSFI